MSDVALLQVARTLAVDGWTTEAVRRLEAAGVPVVLLKGPALAAWLYDHPEERGYGDADLLVPSVRLADAESVLRDAGYGPSRNVHEPPPGTVEHARPWLRPADGAVIDLHHTLSGASTDPVEVWTVMREHTTTFELAGEPVRVLDEPGRALMVCLHAAQHAGKHEHPDEDLRRAIERVRPEVWDRAAVLARRVSAAEQMAQGLRMSPAGAALADRLGLTAAGLLDAAKGHATVIGFERLAAAASARERARLIAREVAPTPGFLHWWAPWSTRSRGALAAAYVYRAGWLAVHAGPGWRAWRRARRSAL